MSERLFVETGSDASGWQRMRVTFDDPALFSDLEANINVASDMVGGSSQARVVDADGFVYAHLVRPYEGIEINLAGDGTNAVSLELIRADYGIDKSKFTQMCRAWLEAHAE